jgi:urease accessory protein
VAAAVKLVPLGHTAGQRLMLALGDEIPAAAASAAACRDDEIGLSLPGLAIASSLHETQYTRLFRS